MSDEQLFENACEELKHAFFGEISDGFLANVLRPDLKLQHRKELIEMAMTQLERFKKYYIKKLQNEIE